MDWENFEKALLDYDRPKVYKILQHFLAENKGIDFIEAYIVKSLTSIGTKWENGEVALSQVYMSSRLCEEIALSILPEKSFKDNNASPIAIVTLEDYHTLGKKLVCTVMRSSGFEVIDYGSVIEPEDILKKVIEDRVKILMISVLMYPTALKIKNISKLFREKAPSVKILVGGAPFLMDSTLWKEVGADAMGKSAADSIIIVEQWIKEDS
jgi:methylmalonyl-CoA mutase cobalamin-binding domain/chain